MAVGWPIRPVITSVAAGALLGAPVGAGQTSGVKEDAIVWSVSRRLTWDDFKAKPIREMDGARSALSYQQAAGCRDGRLEYRVLATFIPSQSSVTYRIISSGLASRVGIHHEQIHFDIAELYARRIRRMYSELSDPCPQSDDALLALADPLLREASERQRQFDDQTSRGEREAKQIEWDKQIATELQDLNAFRDPG